MKWLSNVYDPTLPDAKSHVLCVGDETREEAWESQEQWLFDKVLGVPQETDAYTVLELVRAGMVGVYLPDEENQRLDR